MNGRKEEAYAHLIWLAVGPRHEVDMLQLPYRFIDHACAPCSQVHWHTSLRMCRPPMKQIAATLPLLLQEMRLAIGLWDAILVER